MEANYFGSGKDAPPFKTNATILKENPNHQFNRAGSRLADVTGKKATDAVKEAALDHNLPFATSGYEHGGLPARFSASSPVLYRRIIAYPGQEEVQAETRDQVIALTDWVVANIFRPAEVKKELNDARTKLAAAGRPPSGATGLRRFPCIGSFSLQLWLHLRFPP